MTFKRDVDLIHWKNHPFKKITILREQVVDGINIYNFQIRQYTHNCSSQKDHTIFTIYMETNNNKIETRYNQGNLMNDNNIENVALSIKNFNGVYSIINRLLIELNNF